MLTDSSSKLLYETRYLDGSRVRLWYPAQNARPRCEIKDEVCFLEVKAYRCFPLTHPDDFISLRDPADKEIGILRNLSSMDVASRAILEAELDRKYFTPLIEKIHSLVPDASMWIWDVETQRGRIKFYLRGVRDSIHEVAPRRWQIFSMDGQRYEIRDLEKLDAKSRALFESLF